MSAYECDVCGLCDSDLPDDLEGVDEMFEQEGGKTWCVVHSQAEVDALFAESGWGAPVYKDPEGQWWR